MDFAREGRIAVAEVTVAAEVTLLCQRCLSPLKWSVDSTGRAALVATAAEAEAGAGDAGGRIGTGKYRISIRIWSRKSWLLALPLVPRHENNECAGD